MFEGPRSHLRLDYHFLSRLISGDTQFLIVSVLVGGAVGFIAVGFNRLLGASERVFGGLPAWALAPALGGLAVGLITVMVDREARGHGVPEVMEAIARRGGRISARGIVVKAVTAALTIGSGGSTGPEGPIVYMGAGTGSSLASVWRMGASRTRTLVGAGAAAGIAAIFNAPIGGVLFALEVVLGEFSAVAFSQVVVAAVTASVISRNMLGSAPVYSVPAYALRHPAELLLYALLGLVLALVSRAFMLGLYESERAFDRSRLPAWLRPTAGGALVGLVAIWLPEILGTGHAEANRALAGGGEAWFLLLVGVVKLGATVVTLGSGGSGGVFGPTLVIGAMLGGAFGVAADRFFPSIAASPGAYALVGMGALLAGTTGAPLTAIIMLFEVTGDYRIILPLMLAAVTASSAARLLGPETIYTFKFRRLGLDIAGGRDRQVLERLTVAQAMSPNVVSVPVDGRLGDVVRLMQETRHGGFPVVDPAGRVVGMVTLEDVRRTPLAGRLETPVETAMTRRVVTVGVDTSLQEASARFAFRGIGRLPVVDADGRLVGIVTRSDLIDAYNRATLNGADPGRAYREPRARTEDPGRVSDSASGADAEDRTT